MGVSGMKTDAQKSFNFDCVFCLVSCVHMNVFFNNRCGDREDSSHGVMDGVIHHTPAGQAVLLPYRVGCFIYIT